MEEKMYMRIVERIDSDGNLRIEASPIDGAFWWDEYLLGAEVLEYQAFKGENRVEESRVYAETKIEEWRKIRNNYIVVTDDIGDLFILDDTKIISEDCSFERVTEIRIGEGSGDPDCVVCLGAGVVPPRNINSKVDGRSVRGSLFPCECVKEKKNS